MPYVALKGNLKVINLQNKFCYHKRHNTQYPISAWYKTARIFNTEQGINESNVEKTTQLVHNFIKLNSKNVTL